MTYTPPVVTAAQAEDTAAAAAAVERADAKELHVLFDRAQARYAELAGVFDTVVSHYVGAKDIPRHVASQDAIAAMRDVALAALSLAQLVIVAQQAKKAPVTP